MRTRKWIAEYYFVAYSNCSNTMSLNNRKQERDYSAEVKALQPEVEELAKVS